MFKKVVLVGLLILTMVFSFEKYVITADAMCSGAVSAILIETSSNGVIYEKNAYKRLPMASTTKIMTAICAIESGDIEKVISVDDKAIGIEGSSIYLQKGEKLTLKELLYGLMLSSGNDAAVAIAYGVSGSVEEFCKLMNETAKKIGAKNTNFENPSGLDSKQHYTTAYDLAIITSYALKNKEFAQIVSTYTTKISNGDKGYDRQLKNHNKLLKMYEDCTGVKTGFTRKCGRCLVSSAKRNGVELVAVTLNDGNDWADHSAMLNYGFENTESVTLIKKGDYLRMLNVDGGYEKIAEAIAENDLTVVKIKGENKELALRYTINPNLNAPISYGDVVGKIFCEIGDRKTHEINAVIDRSVSEKPKGESIRNFVIFLKMWIGI